MRLLSKIFIVILFVLSLFSSCEMIIDKDTTEDVSTLSVKPIITVLGDPIISLEEGQSYTDAGIEVYAGENDFTHEIASGEVNPNQLGFYVVTYRAVNEYDWESFAYRSVLVHDGSPYKNEELAGTYKPNALSGEVVPLSVTEKHPINGEENGFWKIDNAWDGPGVNFPIIFCESPLSDTLNVVPQVHPEKGRYFGYGFYKVEPPETIWGDTLKYLNFNLEIYPPEGGRILKSLVVPKVENK